MQCGLFYSKMGVRVDERDAPFEDLVDLVVALFPSVDAMQFISWDNCGMREEKRGAYAIWKTWGIMETWDGSHPLSLSSEAGAPNIDNSPSPLPWEKGNLLRLKNKYIKLNLTSRMLLFIFIYYFIKMGWVDMRFPQAKYCILLLL